MKRPTTLLTRGTPGGGERHTRRLAPRRRLLDTAAGLGAVALLAVVSLAWGCQEPQVKYDHGSGPDRNRVGARKVFPGQRITDSLNAGVGDHTDWKEISIPEPGTMAVTVALDDTRGMKGFVSLKDSFGIEMDRRPLNASDNLYTFDRVPVYQGAYFVQVFADKGNSVYTTGVTFEPLNRRVRRQPRVLPQPEPKKSRPRYSSRPKPKAAEPAKEEPVKEEPVKEAPKADPEKMAEPVVEPGEEAVLVRGRVIRITPRENGGAILAISGLGSADGVSAGMSGVISKLGKGFTVTQVRANSATATTKADPDKIKGFTNVVVKVKKKK